MRETPSVGHFIMRQDGLPDSGRSGLFEAQLGEIELSFADAVY